MVYSDFAHPLLKDFKERIEDQGYYSLEFSQSAALNKFLKFMDWAKPDLNYALYPLKKNMNMGQGSKALGIGNYGEKIPLQLSSDIVWTYSGMRMGFSDDLNRTGTNSYNTYYASHTSDETKRYATLDFSKIPLNTKYDITVFYLANHAVPEKIERFYNSDIDRHLSHNTYFFCDGSDENYSIVAPYWSKNIYKAGYGITTLHDDELGTELKGVQVQTIQTFDSDYNQNDIWNPYDAHSNGDLPFCISVSSAKGYIAPSELEAYGNRLDAYLSGSYNGGSGYFSRGSETSNVNFYSLRTHGGANTDLNYPWQTPLSATLSPYHLVFGLQQNLSSINTIKSASLNPGLRHWALAILVMSGYTESSHVDLISEIFTETMSSSNSDIMKKKYGSDDLFAQANLSGFLCFGHIITGEYIYPTSSLSELEQRVMIKKFIKYENLSLSSDISYLLQRIDILENGYEDLDLVLSGSLSSFKYSDAIALDPIYDTIDSISGSLSDFITGTGYDNFIYASGVDYSTVNIQEWLEPIVGISGVICKYDAIFGGESIIASGTSNITGFSYQGGPIYSGISDLPIEMASGTIDITSFSYAGGPVYSGTPIEMASGTSSITGFSYGGGPVYSGTPLEMASGAIEITGFSYAGTPIYSGTPIEMASGSSNITGFTYGLL